jgi:hypothetical protein
VLGGSLDFILGVVGFGPEIFITAILDEKLIIIEFM